MSKKAINKTLSIIFIILLAVVIITYIIDSEKGDRTFKKELVTTDTSKVTSINILPKKDTSYIKIFRTSDNNWKLRYKGKNVNADKNTVNEMLKELTNLQPKSVAATSQTKWKEFEVTDSLATRVKLLKGSKTVADVMIGKFSYKQNPMTRRTEITSYVRLSNENMVYAIDGFLNMTFNRKPKSFRDNTVISSKANSWNKITYNYPSDSSFTLIKQKNKWMVNGLLADSIITIRYLRTISHLNNSNFIDNINYKNNKPVYSVKIEGNNMKSIEINAFSTDSLNQYVVTSSENKGTYFDGSKILKKLYVNKNYFRKKSK